MEPIADNFKIVITYNDDDERRQAEGQFFVSWAGDSSMMKGPYLDEEEAIAAAKLLLETEGESEAEMLILRIAKRLKLFTRIEVEISPP